MKRSRFVRAIALCLAVLMLTGAFVGTVAADESTAGSTTAAQIRELLNTSSYKVYNEKQPTTKGEGQIVIDATAPYSYEVSGVVYYYDAVKKTFYTVDGAGLRTDVASDAVAAYVGDHGGQMSLYSPADGKLSWQVTIPKSGRYAIEIEYYPLGKNVSSIERVFYINGKVPFSQARYLTMSKSWAYDYEYADTDASKEDPFFKADLGGNELKPEAAPSPEWMKYQFSDSDGFYQGAFEFYFNNEDAENVTHTISLEAAREAMAIKSIRLYPYVEAPKYSDVLASDIAAGYKTAGADAHIKLEAEKPYRVSDTSVYASNDRTSAVNSPTDPNKQLLNVLGANSYDTIGQWASYQFTPTKTGLYTISVRCKQDELAGMYTSRTVRLAGGKYGDTLAVPFREAYDARFNYDKAWQIATLSNGDEVFQFYFEAGVTYTVSFEVSLGTLSDIIEQVETSLSVINDCYLEILKLTGPEPDQYRDYKFERVMPQTLRNLLIEANNLEDVSEELTRLSGSRGSHVATLDQVFFLLREMGRDNGTKIAENLGNLKSYIGTLGTWLNTSKQQSLMMDYIVVSGTEKTETTVKFESKLDPSYKENANFFESAGYEIVAFFQSFFTSYDQMGVTEKLETNTRVEVWIATGRDQASIWRGLVDSSFTSTDAGRGIAIDLKLVAAGSLLPSVLAKKGPDLYIGLDAGSVINYAIRSAVLPITDFTDAEPDILSEFNSAALAPIIMHEELYGLPETLSFPMMFYRKDVLANLDRDVPTTWEEVLKLVPLLQSQNMQIGLTRNYHLFLYQRDGGDRWVYDGTNYSKTGKFAELMSDETFYPYFDYMRIAYDTDVALDAFRYMCRFYTDYSFPIAFDSANRFRTGEMPIVIADAVSMYNQLTVFATEIRGLWMFTDVPGTERADGSINRTVMASVTATVVMNGVRDKAATWKFMSWQVGSDVQAEYGNSMVSLIGPAAKYNTANMAALEKMSWTTEEYKNLYSQFTNIASVPNYPGAYIIDRYLEFAFLNATEGANPVDELRDYTKTINKEINRKRVEFELPIIENAQTIDDSIENYIAYLKTLNDSQLAGYSEYVRNYVKNYKG